MAGVGWKGREMGVMSVTSSAIRPFVHCEKLDEGQIVSDGEYCRETVCRSKWGKNNIASHNPPRARAPHISRAQPHLPHRTPHVYRARRGIPRAWQLRRKREGLSLVHGSKIRSRRCRTIKLVYQYLWKANLVQRGSTHFMYIIERIPSKNPRFSKPEALVWHTRNH